jgi:hypothetical protein
MLEKVTQICKGLAHFWCSMFLGQVKKQLSQKRRIWVLLLVIESHYNKHMYASHRYVVLKLIQHFLFCVFLHDQGERNGNRRNAYSSGAEVEIFRVSPHQVLERERVEIEFSMEDLFVQIVAIDLRTQRLKSIANLQVLLKKLSHLFFPTFLLSPHLLCCAFQLRVEVECVDGDGREREHRNIGIEELRTTFRIFQKTLREERMRKRTKRR